jgi:hypothetical protein
VPRKNIEVNHIVGNIEAMNARRQILDWRDKWLLQIPVILARDLPQLLAVLDARIERISFRNTFQTDKFIQQNVQPEYKRWAETKSREIINLATRELDLIIQKAINYDHQVEEQIVTDDSRHNVAELGVAVGSTGIALLGAPAVATLSVNSAGWGLGLLGATVISWPVALGGAAVLGTMAMFGGSRLATYKDKATSQLKESVERTVRSSVLGPSRESPSIKAMIQSHIKYSASFCLEELQNV